LRAVQREWNKLCCKLTRDESKRFLFVFYYYPVRNPTSEREVATIADVANPILSCGVRPVHLVKKL